MAICFVETIMNIHLLPDKSWAGHRLDSTQRINDDELRMDWHLASMVSHQLNMRYALAELVLARAHTDCAHKLIGSFNYARSLFPHLPTTGKWVHSCSHFTPAVYWPHIVSDYFCNLCAIPLMNNVSHLSGTRKST